MTTETLRDKWLGVEEKPVMLLEVFRKHNEQVEQLGGEGLCAGYAESYRTSLLHTRNFIKWKYKAEDIDVKKLDFGFISDYEFWLKSVRGCAHNTTMKYLSNFKKGIHICLKNG